jgi:hypothetical protein
MTTTTTTTPPPTGMGFKAQVAVVLAFYVGLFFVEYPPIFILGYWSWGALVHKVITGVLIALNLVITQYAARRLGLFESVQKADRGDADGRNPLA